MDPIATHSFTSHGKATVTLTVYDTEGKNNSTLKQLTIYARPIANFTIDSPSPYIVNQTLTFNATTSYDPDNITAPNRGIARYTWNFGDGNVTIIGDNESITPIVNHVFTAEKSYNVVLAVIDLDGIMSSPNRSMLVSVSLGRPVALFKPPSEPCYVCHPLFFDASDSYDPNNRTAHNNGIVYYRWDFDDDNVTTVYEPTITHHYEEPGSYNLNLTVADSDGLNASVIKTVNVAFQVLVNVVDNKTGTANVAYNPEERFKVNITVTDVVDLHSFEFNLTYSCILLTIENVELGNFLGSAGDINWDREFPSCRGYAWASGERLLSGGVSGSGTLAVITFHVNNRTGNCTLRINSSILKNSSEAYINHTQTHGIFYTTKPVASFAHSPEFPSVNEEIVFDASESRDPDNSYDDLPGILNYTWVFGDNTTISVVGTIENPPSPIISHNYTANGTYQVMLLVTDDDGETWNFTHQITIEYTHDIAVISVQPFQFAFNETLGVYETSGMLLINVTVINKGDTPGENVSVTLYAKNATQTVEIETKSIYLSGSIPKNLTFYVYAFKWNLTHGLPKGDYIIGANITLSGDVNLTDNSCEDGVVRVYLAGDVNHDSITDMKDVGIVVKAFGSTPGHTQWNPHCDLNTDGKIDMKDIGIVVRNFGKTPL